MKKISFMKSKKSVTYVKKNLVLIMTKSIVKELIIVITQENLEELLIVFVIKDIKHQKKFQYYFIMVTHMVIINFIINKLVKEFDGHLECLGENTEKYITFSVPISKEIDN